MSTTPRPRPRPKGAHAACLALAVIACLVAPATAALAVSTRDLVALAQAGLSDDVLVALIEADGTVFSLDAPRILELRQQGLSERVIMAMLRSGRQAAPPQAAAPQAPAAPLALADLSDGAPTLVIIGETPAPPVVQVQQTSVIVVPWVPVFRAPAGPPSTAPTLQGLRGFGRFINDGWVDGRPPSGAR